MDLDLSWHMQFGCVQFQQAIQSTEDQDRNDDGKVTDQGTKLENIQEEQRRREQRTIRYRYGGLSFGEVEGRDEAAAICLFSQ